MKALSVKLILILAMSALVVSCDKGDPWDNNPAVLQKNTEYRCDLVTMSFYANGQLNRNDARGAKPVYYQFDGRNLRAYYKESNAPKVRGDGAQFVDAKTVSEEGRSGDIINFELSGETEHKIEFFKETTSGASNPLILIDKLSSDNFSTYIEFVSVCK